MESLKKKKRVVKRNITRLQTTCKPYIEQRNLDIEKLSKLEYAITEYRSLKQSFDEIVNEMFMLADENDDKFAEFECNLSSELTEVSDFLHQCEGKIRVFHKLLSTEESRRSLVPSHNSSFTQSSAAPKLEKIKVPTFNGNILEWLNFKSLFENLVHNNSDLSNVQKLHYLKEALTDTAKDLIRNFELNDESYAQAWSFLQLKFDNPRSIVRALFRKLHDLETIKVESDIRMLADQVDVIVSGLKSAGETVDNLFSRYLTYHVTRRLDIETARDWDNSLLSNRFFPTYDQLQKFLQNRVFTAEERAADFKSIKKGKDSKGPIEKFEKKQPDKKPLVAVVASKLKCVVCSNQHYLNQCAAFAAKSVNERFEIVKKNRLCLKCFNPFHNVADCKRNNCSSCNGRHNNLLHRESKPVVNSLNSPTVNSTPSHSSQPNAVKPNVTKTICIGTTRKCKIVLLPTAVVFILVNGKRYLARVLLDSGAETCLVLRSFVKRTNLTIRPADEVVSLAGITDGSKILDSSASMLLRSRFSEYQIVVSAEIIDRIPYQIPKETQKCVELNSEFQFAECELPYDDIDIVIGSEYFELVMKDKRHIVDTLVFRETNFGVVISGAQPASVSLSIKRYCGLSRTEIERQFEKFCKIKGYEFDDPSSPTESVAVEKHFEETYSRAKPGPFVVQLPKKLSIDCLNGSFEKALRIYLKSEKRRSPLLNIEYHKFMNEYEQLGHMRKLTENEIRSDAYYIPHHIVQKPSSTTTKYRVVFNASMVDNSLTSLNDHLMVGPKLQSELVDIIIRFREHRIAFCADIEKMYRQILVHPADRKYQRILYRAKPDSPVEHYELNTVTYGTSPASYLATKCLQVVANEIELENPSAAVAIKRDFYMDDFMSGANSIEEAIELQQIVHQILLSQLSTSKIPKQLNEISRPPRSAISGKG